MNDLKRRIQKRIKMTADSWKTDSYFSRKYAALRVTDEFSHRLGFQKVSFWAYKKREEWMIDYLRKLLAPVIEKYRDQNNAGQYTENAPIWVCWWSGLDTAPPLVKQCVKSIQKNAGTHPVKVITAENFREYVNLSPIVLRKLAEGQICLANFSDYLRASLISEHGGLWADATLFSTDEIPNSCFNIPVFTCKSVAKKGKYISQYQWCSFCLGGWKNNVFFRFFREAIEYYWEREPYAIDYLLVDAIIYIAKNDIPAATKYLEAVPINNVHRDDLQAAMNQGRPAKDFWGVIQPDTTLYKLSWRENYELFTEDGQQTVYGYFLEMDI